MSSSESVSSMDFMAMKRSQLYGMANNPYSTPQQPGGGPYPPSQPYTSPPPHRYPMGMQGRSQMGMGGMQYPQQQVAPYGQQVMGGYSQQQQQQQQAGQQGTPPYFSPPQQTPPGPTQSPYLQPRPPPQQQLRSMATLTFSDGNGVFSSSLMMLQQLTLADNYAPGSSSPRAPVGQSTGLHLRRSHVGCHAHCCGDRGGWFPEAQQESYNTRGSAPGNSGKANNEDSVSQDRPSSLPVSDRHFRPPMSTKHRLNAKNMQLKKPAFKRTSRNQSLLCTFKNRINRHLQESQILALLERVARGDPNRRQVLMRERDTHAHTERGREGEMERRALRPWHLLPHVTKLNQFFHTPLTACQAAAQPPILREMGEDGQPCGKTERGPGG
ncbi:putative AT-rich interactive domain-containing protein 1B-like [Scophthalmus maximus]|uniref:Putative AT-rich interactive domain-containing protein 1B-like n=1 Tax=Scophthalmus maximus TaxID=52904 RepID=A0A2U9CPT9_SCOMX|nr:putative AT-rich interactive domain-containing protein 1B-like [Scophthalmus maximus]